MRWIRLAVWAQYMLVTDRQRQTDRQTERQTDGHRTFANNLITEKVSNK